MTAYTSEPDGAPGRTRLAPPQRAAPLRRPQVAAAVSVVGHLAAVLLLLFAIPRPPVQLTADSQVELMFDDATSTEPSTSAVTANDRPAAEAVPERPAPSEPALPSPAQPQPPPAPVEPPTPDPVPVPAEPAPPTPVPPDSTPPTTEPPPVVPVPEAATRSRPVVRLEAPPTAEPEPETPEFKPPTAPRPLPPLPPQPLTPRPPAPPRVVERPRYAPGFSPPIDLSFGPVPPRQALPPGSRAVDLALGAPKAGPNRQEAFYDARARKIGADWANGLTAWWLAHRYYPRQAIENGDDGTVKVQLVINRSGKVEEAEIISRSGSPFLDMAALSTWRGAQLAPFPAENPKPRETIEITINYLLLR